MEKKKSVKKYLLEEINERKEKEKADRSMGGYELPYTNSRYDSGDIYGDDPWFNDNMGRWKYSRATLQGNGTLILRNATRIPNRAGVVEEEFLIGGRNNPRDIILRTRALNSQEIKRVSEAKQELGMEEDLRVIIRDKSAIKHRIYGIAVDGIAFVRADILERGNRLAIHEAIDHERGELSGIGHDELRERQKRLYPDDDLRKLIRELSDEDKIEKGTAPDSSLQSSSPIGDDIDDLLEILRNREDEDGKIDAMKAIGKFGPDAEIAIKPLTILLSHRSRAIRSWAAATLGEIGPKAKTAVRTLIQTLDDREPIVRDAAAEALGRIGPAAEEGVPKLRTLVESDDNPFVRLYAQIAVARIGYFIEETITYLINALQDNDPLIRRDAADALVGLAHQAEVAIPSLIGALSDEDVGVQFRAVRALGNMREPARVAIPSLERVLTVQAVSEAAAIALKLLKNGSSWYVRKKLVEYFDRTLQESVRAKILHGKSSLQTDLVILFDGIFDDSRGLYNQIYRTSTVEKIRTYLSNLPSNYTFRHYEIAAMRQVLEDPIAPFSIRDKKKKGTASDSQSSPPATPKSSSPVSEDDKLGGIDMNTIDLERLPAGRQGEGAGVDIQFDPAQLQEIIESGIDGFAPVIINIVPLPSVLPLLGLDPVTKEEELEMTYLNLGH